MSLVMADKGQPVFRDFMGTGHRAEAKQPEASVTDSVRNSQQRSAQVGGCDEGEVSTKACSMYSAPQSPMAGASAPLALPTLADPTSEIWKHAKAGVIAQHGSNVFSHKDVEHDHGKKRDALAGRDLFLNGEASQGSRPSKVCRSKEEEFKRGHGESSSLPGDLRLAMQPPRPSSTTGGPLWMQTSVFKTDLSTGASKKVESSRPVISNSALPLNTSSGGRFNAVAANIGERALPKENGGGFPLVPQPPADEGSRTGLQGAGLAQLLNAAPSKLVTADPTAHVAASVQTKLQSRNTGSDSAAPSHQITPPATRQLTIFYGGQAHVFDDVSPEKADEIMLLAGSNGRSWSTTYAHRPPTSQHSAASQGLELERQREKLANHGSSQSKTGTHMLPSDVQSLLQGLARVGGGVKPGNSHHRQEPSSARLNAGPHEIAESLGVDGSAVKANMNGKEPAGKGRQQWM